MGFDYGFITGESEFAELTNCGWFVSEFSKSPYGEVEVTLSSIREHLGIPSITLRGGSANYIRQFLADCIDYDALRNLGADDDLADTVVGGVASVGGPTLPTVADDEAAATGPTPKDTETGEEAV